jgi:hypothetical protein
MIAKKRPPYENVSNAHILCSRLAHPFKVCEPKFGSVHTTRSALVM